MSLVTLSKILLAIGFCIMTLCVMRCGYFIFMKKDVATEFNLMELVATWIYFFLICLGLIFYFVAIMKDPDYPWFGPLLFGGSLVVAVSLTWVIGLSHSVKRRSLKITGSLIGIMETRDRHLDGHSIHIERLVSLMYEYLPFNMKLSMNPENLRYAALFHDIGKLGVPHEILNKPGKLTNEEWELMRRHPEISIEILKPINSFEPILDWIKYHHERMDGRGYYKLQGDKIPLASKMLAVADTFSSVTLSKSYKPSRTYEDGISALKSAAGNQLDPELVQIFCDIPKHRIMECAMEIEAQIDMLTGPQLLETVEK